MKNNKKDMVVSVSMNRLIKLIKETELALRDYKNPNWSGNHIGSFSHFGLCIYFQQYKYRANVANYRYKFDELPFVLSKYLNETNDIYLGFVGKRENRIEFLEEVLTCAKEIRSSHMAYRYMISKQKIKKNKRNVKSKVSKH